MQAYLDLMRDALENGAVKMDRTGTGVRSLFGRQLRFDLHGNNFAGEYCDQIQQAAGV